jgi:parallel beta-helix repeat protein
MESIHYLNRKTPLLLMGALVLIVFCFTRNCLRISVSGSAFKITNTTGKTFEASFSSIQQAINDAADGSTIEVPSGIYYEHISINKTINLVGEDVSSTIIDGGNNGTVVEITRSLVNISNFTIRNSGYGWTKHGIYVFDAENVTIKGNWLHDTCHNIKLNFTVNTSVIENTINGTMTQPTMYGIRVQNSIDCTISGNKVSDCVGAVHLENATGCVISNNLLQGNSQGIRLYTPCVSNEIRENIVYNNTYDGMVDTMPYNSTLLANRFFHNNFIENENTFVYRGTSSCWDNGYPSGGNYWSKYDGADEHSGEFQNEIGYDGIGDTVYNVSSYEKDRYSLMHPYGSVMNIETNMCYLTIQSAINAPETLDGHEITVKSGIYREHIMVNKSLSLIGENRTTTIIDGGRAGSVVAVVAENVSLIGFTIRNSGSNYPPYGNDCGLLLDHSVSGNISFNIFVDNRIGVYLFFSEQNHLEDNLAYSNIESGIWLWHSGRNTLRRNTLFNNTYGFGVFGNSFEKFNNSIDMTNNVEGKPIRYVVGGANEIFDGESTGTLYLINCVNITVRNLNLTGNGHGVFYYNVTQSRIQNLTASGNNYGVDLLSSHNNTVSNNYCENNWVGIRLESSNNNTVKNNTLVAGEKGISLYEADSNRVEGNTIRNTAFGIRLSTSHSNRIYRNNFVQNIAQADLVNSNQNVWDDGHEGNFWSDNNVADGDRDGIVDEEYIVSAVDRDRFPMSGLYHIFEVKFEANPQEVGVISNSTVLGLTFEEGGRAIVLTVEGPDETLGFCRVRVPHSLVEPELNVIIDGGLVDVAYANYSLFDDGACRSIYFEYMHSAHEIVILYEFQWLDLWLLIAALTISLLLFSKDRIMRQR